ncbi:MAG: hypothetical protein ACPGYY_03045 [Bacteroidia bacterium]
MTSKIISVFVLVLFLGSCKTVTTAEGEKVDLFKGTIVYDVEVVQKVDTFFEKNKKALFGNEMVLTVFRNGDIQKVYNGASSKGYDLHYISLEDNVVIEKYNNNDSLYTHAASTQNISKINDLRGPKQEISILDHSLKEVAIAAQEAPTSHSSGNYLTIKYWYTDALKIDKTRYTNVNDDLWNYFINKSDGSLYLKYEIDYFTYKVIYTAKEILPNKFDKAKDKLGKEAPQVQE